MKLTQKITLALGVLAAVSASKAAPAPAVGPTGLLGTQYSELNFGVQDIKHISKDAYSLGVAANTALVPGVLDGGANYNYSWIGGAYRGHVNAIGAYTNVYTVLNGVKPFAGAGLGYEWRSFKGGNDNVTTWNLAAGVEIPAGVVTVTPKIIYHDDFEKSRNSGQDWTYQVEANYWFNQKTAAFGSIGYQDVRQSSNDAWIYTVGLRAKF